jgi:hypothetical protein
MFPTVAAPAHIRNIFSCLVALARSRSVNNFSKCRASLEACGAPLRFGQWLRAVAVRHFGPPFGLAGVPSALVPHKFNTALVLREGRIAQLRLRVALCAVLWVWIGDAIHYTP